MALRRPASHTGGHQARVMVRPEGFDEREHLCNRGQAMARLQNPITPKTIARHLKAPAGQTGSAKRNGLAANVGGFSRHHLGRDILVEVLTAAARVLRDNRERLQQVRPSDRPGDARPRSVASAGAQVSTEAKLGAAGTEAKSGAAGGGVKLASVAVSFAQPVAGSLTLAPLVQRGASIGQARQQNGLSTGKAQEGVHLYDLRRTSCRWPLGTFLASTQLFCGAPSIPGCPYCTEHRERAFNRFGIARAKRAAGGAAVPVSQPAMTPYRRQRVS